MVLLTNKDYAPMYNSALVMQQELQAVGINAQMKVVDWPTSVQMSQDSDSRLELLLHRLGHAARAWARLGDDAVPGRIRTRSISRRATRAIPS